MIFREYYNMTLISYAQLFSDGSIIPPGKLGTIHLNIKNVFVFEFKSKHLRIYFFHSKSNPDRIVALCGYKNKQKSDINLTSLIKRYLNI